MSELCVFHSEYTNRQQYALFNSGAGVAKVPSEVNDVALAVSAGTVAPGDARTWRLLFRKNGVADRESNVWVGVVPESECGVLGDPEWHWRVNNRSVGFSNAGSVSNDEQGNWVSEDMNGQMNVWVDGESKTKVAISKNIDDGDVIELTLNQAGAEPYIQLSNLSGQRVALPYSGHSRLCVRVNNVGHSLEILSVE